MKIISIIKVTSSTGSVKYFEDYLQAAFYSQINASDQLTLQSCHAGFDGKNYSLLNKLSGKPDLSHTLCTDSDGALYQVKENVQLEKESPEYSAIKSLVMQAVDKSPRLEVANLKQSPMLFSATQPTGDKGNSQERKTSHSQYR